MNGVAQRVLVSSIQAAKCTGLINSTKAMSSFVDSYKFETLAVSSPKTNVLHIEFNRPEKMNTMTTGMWQEMVECFNKASIDENVRSIVLSGRGKLYTAGLDLVEAASSLAPSGNDVAREAFRMYKFIGLAQESCSAIEKCMKPVITAVHNGCLGGGMDVISACDIRLCDKDAYFSVKEVDVGLAADMGSLQRLPRILGNDSLIRDLCFTGRKMKSDEAKSCGLVSTVYEDKEKMMEGAFELAELIATKSPVAVQSIKVSLNYGRNHSVNSGLEHIRSWNAAMLQTEDIMKSAQALMMKKTPADVKYSKL
ncbi:delta(3,5)-Delta(2,4)-dienoyl-CoA isomerase, mitochondrial-like isoform X1 [Ciona intestinalis]